MRYDWDADKARRNLAKHGVSFEEAVTVFDDENRIEDYDVEHSAVEDRWAVVGLAATLRVLVVVYVERGKDGEIVRVITARKATSDEVKRYERQR